MASYRIVWKRSAQKELRKLPQDVIARIVNAVEGLTENPTPPGAKKLAGTARTYRLRVGEYRIVYDVGQGVLVIEVIRVGHRREIYRQLS